MDNASHSAFGAEATELVPGAAPSLFGISLWFVSGRGSISINGLALSHLQHLPLESKKQHPADVKDSSGLLQREPRARSLASFGAFGRMNRKEFYHRHALQRLAGAR